MVQQSGDQYKSSENSNKEANQIFEKISSRCVGLRCENDWRETKYVAMCIDWKQKVNFSLCKITTRKLF